MTYEVYSNLTTNDDYSVFEFISIGTKGNIRKRIAFTPTELNGVYNLAFGDVDENDDIDDYSITGNGDRNKILSTIARVIDFYTQNYPDRWIYFQGSTIERTRLYRMAISINIEELTRKFNILI